MTKGEPFLAASRVITMRRDIDRLRKAIRSHDPVASDAALDKCERWFDQLSPNEGE